MNNRIYIGKESKKHYASPNLILDEDGELGSDEEIIIRNENASDELKEEKSIVVTLTAAVTQKLIFFKYT